MAADAIDWGARTNWTRAAPPFERVFVRDYSSLVTDDEDVDVETDVEVAMTFRPTNEAWSLLRTMWRKLRPHPHVLEAVADEGYGLSLRYAAIDWYPELESSAVNVARWIVQVADAYRAIAKDLGPDDLWMFGKPIVFFDLGGAVRLAFDWPGEAARRRLDERDLVYIIGSRLLASFPEAAAPVGAILATCTHVEPKRRYRTLAALQKACRKAVLMDEPIRKDDLLVAWEYVEAGLGLLAVHRDALALEQFKQAFAFDDFTAIARWGRDESRRRSSLEPIAQRSRYRMKPPRTSDPIAGLDVEQLLAEARRALASHDAAYAMALAQELLRREPENADAMTTLVAALFELGHNSEAIGYADALVARAPGEGSFHYLRGKVLFQLGRLPEARDAFERALVLAPTLAEALHLRREVDRAIGTARRTVGSQRAPVIEIAASLEPLRAVLARGESREIVHALSALEYDANADAQLLLARFLALDGELGRASGIYQRLLDAPPPHRQRALAGKAGLLLGLGLAESALALFDVVCAEAPGDLDASEGRAQALERLGRVGEAAAEYRRFVGLANARADLRVRAAQEWLDAHAL